MRPRIEVVYALPHRQRVVSVELTAAMTADEAERAAGLMASLLASSPAWRHVDPLPVLGRDEEEEEYEVAEEDKERRDEEHRAKWVLEDR